MYSRVEVIGSVPCVGGQWAQQTNVRPASDDGKAAGEELMETVAALSV
jgi:hypothetical protein